MATATKIIATCLILAVSMQMCSSSAIPIWEFLTRNEKMSYLYSTFAQLVSVHCKATATTAAVPVNQCKRNLLGYGYDKLQSFTDAQLDAVDPYQHGANELIWASIMRDHPSAALITTRKPLPTPPASSIVILTHQQPIKSSATTQSASASTQHYPQNPLFDSDGEHWHQYAMDMDGYSSSTQPAKTWLSGPLVFRVRPDGTPVEEDQYKMLPRDDDLEASEAFGRGSSTEAARPNVSGRRHKHRKIATISALKQQRLATLALQQQLQPPLEETRVRRQFQVPQQLQTPTGGGYFYAKGQS